MNNLIVSYDPSQYRFHDWASRVLGVACLGVAHESSEVKKLNRSPTINQLASSFSDILETYKLFVLNVVAKEFEGISTYQCPPSFRFHYCGSGSSVFHRDRDFGVEDGRINVWVPLTQVWGDNSLWIESEIGSNDYTPLSLDLGQALIFDGVNLGHGSKINTTASTRVSFDFRFQPGPGPAKRSSY
ncbi:hypothetical protein [Synechococcus sp. MIT S1220]|uniref:hypothetical protein n=1 Tax=Synechococcus sp. MIT S1220 TaxID=3082549 RepID=UPI0039B0D205